jgi:hypothetical protein
MTSEPLIFVMTRRIPQAMSGPCQGMQRGHGDNQWLPKGATWLACGDVRPLAKDSAIGSATCLATREADHAEVMRINRTGH